MELSACNRLSGTVRWIVQGKVCAQVQLELPGGELITALITSEAVERLGLKEGTAALAVVKSSSVMIATP